MALPVAVFISQKTVNIAPRAAVVAVPQSYLTLVPESTPSAGQDLIVDIVLDTTKDPEFVATGIDAIIRFNPDPTSDPAVPPALEAVSVANGSVFETLTQQNIGPETLTLSASNSTIKDDAGLPQGFSGTGTVATITFKVKSTALDKVGISFVYNSASSTDDTNIIGFKRDTAIDQQAPRERLLSEPQIFTFNPNSSSLTCIRGGCSGQLCVAQVPLQEQLATTCEMKPEYACYQKATCEIQPDGTCGFTQTEELRTCLAATVSTVGLCSSCQETVSPEYQVHCQSGLVCNPVNPDLTGGPGRCVPSGKTVSEACPATPTPTPVATSPQPTAIAIPAQKCGTYNGVQRCATCGNSKCEPFETCTSSVSGTGGQVSTMDCGVLYCPKDCQAQTTPIPQVTTMPCPRYLAPFCPTGTLVPQGDDARGCPLAPKCVPNAGLCSTCSETVSPEYQVHCQTGLVCNPVNPDLTGGSGKCVPSGKTVSEACAASPTPTPSPTVQINLELTPQSRAQISDNGNLAITGTLYGYSPTQTTEIPIAQAIASFGADATGKATVTVPSQFLQEGKNCFNLFVRTPNHLRKQSSIGPICFNTNNQYGPLKFPDLIPGDIFIPEGQNEQDNVINTFDAIELLKYLGKSSGIYVGGKTYYNKADLNNDGTVNSRDLKILLDNMGKSGDATKVKTLSVSSACAADGTCTTPTSTLPIPIGEIKDIVCTTEYKPVCCDGHTYSNSCEASRIQTFKAQVCTEGACGSTSGGSGIIPTITFEECKAMAGSQITKDLATVTTICITPDGRKVIEGSVRGAASCADNRPVCGSDGQTYSNQCQAEAKGLFWSRGACSQ